MNAPIVLQLDPSPRNARNSEGSFVTLRSGRIVFAYTKYSGRHDDDDAAVIAARSSDDGGRTWSIRDRILIAQEGTANVMSVTFLRLQDGRIALFNLRKDRHQGLLTCHAWLRTSRDELASFTRPALVTTAPGYFVLNNDRVIQLASGRLLMPLGLHRYRLKSELRQPDETQAPYFAGDALILFLFSDDGGRTWFESLTHYTECFPSGGGLQEPGVIELRDGRVQSWCRASPFRVTDRSGFQWQSVSRDQGLTWPAAQPWRPFPAPCSPLSIKRIPGTGHLLAVWNDHRHRYRLPIAQPSSWGRTPLATAISRDDGRTWRHHQLIEKDPGQGFCYTAIHFTDDDHVLLAYCCGGRGRSVPHSRIVLDTLRLRRLPLAALYGR